MAKLKGLGRGLDALLGGAEAPAPGEALRQLPLTALRPGRYQPRTRIEDSSLTELAQSIRAQGVMQPIVARPSDGGYEIVAGERRWRAAKLAGLDEVPVVVREVADRDALALALIENMQREDLSAIEEARGVRRLIDEFDLTHEAAAQAIGRSRSAVSNLLRLLDLAPAVQDFLEAGQLEMGHARALAPLPTAQQVMLAQRIVQGGLSVREAERLAARAGASGRSKRTPPPRDPDLARLEQELADTLAAKVRIEPASGSKGRIVIEYSGLDQLDGLLRRLR